ncbi:MAG: hypoxanthine-guanine phosphoribosyltransferase [Zoogloeaceae bacterium]|jgi:hypoxanthine phosphoribosyltransferase|nr:hypoxanthine-guanine phosphoribosyltransferase [Zoogloeaceae bacterium]
MTMNHEEAQTLLDNAELIHSAETVQAAVANVAARIKAELAGKKPVVLCVMSGAVPFMGHLMIHLDFPLDFDYLHASRYGDHTSGHNKLSWRSGPWIDLKGRTVLVVDDILDEGVTLSAICERIRQMGAARVLTAVFAEKEIGRPKPVKADFVGLTVPNRFVFGFGMDICGAWRNLPAIYACQASESEVRDQKK